MLLEEWVSAESLSWGQENLGWARGDPGHLLPPVSLLSVYLLVDTHKQGLKQTGALIEWQFLQWPFCPQRTPVCPSPLKCSLTPPCTACTSTFFVSSVSSTSPRLSTCPSLSPVPFPWSGPLLIPAWVITIISQLVPYTGHDPSNPFFILLLGTF